MLSKAKYWWFRGWSWWRWYRSASTPYDVHSPGLSRFIDQAWRHRSDADLESLVLYFRRSYRHAHQWIETPQLGAASKVKARQRRRLSELVRHSAIAAAEGHFLARMVRYTKAQTILELGTNAGISGAYLALADESARLHSLEGNPDLAMLARRGFTHLGLNDRVQVHIGRFSDRLPEVLTQLSTIDLLFIDGDHRYQPTLDYVRACLPLARENSLFIIADIHWSPGMEAAWEEIRNWPAVTCSLDTYHFGILFFDPALKAAPSISLIRTRFKPWRLGFF
ncbi:MAG: class I SAM-dependent methyltransferase [Bacteroidota bacterium]